MILLLKAVKTPLGGGVTGNNIVAYGEYDEAWLTNSAVLIHGVGIKKIERLAKGKTRLYLSNPIPGANYSVVGNSQQRSNDDFGHDGKLIYNDEGFVNIPVTMNKTDEYFDIWTSDNNLDLLYSGKTNFIVVSNDIITNSNNDYTFKGNNVLGWCRGNYRAAGVTMLASDNILSITVVSTGILQVNLINPIANARYTVTANAAAADPAGLSHIAAGNIVNAAAVVVPYDYKENSFRLAFINNNIDGFVNAEPFSFSIIGGSVDTSSTNACLIERNGYQILSSGLIMQWGSFTIPTVRNWQRFSFNFPIPFKRELFSITGNYSGHHDGVENVYGTDAVFIAFDEHTLTTMQGKAFERDPASLVLTGYIDWFAIGI